jgi:hypothetical protein
MTKADGDALLAQGNFGEALKLYRDSLTPGANFLFATLLFSKKGVSCHPATQPAKVGELRIWTDFPSMKLVNWNGPNWAKRAGGIRLF